ncbi:MAG TPA: outer membrane protein transport protein [bacterium]|nr:outer membrane protein transport protein [bacterium]
MRESSFFKTFRKSLSSPYRVAIVLFVLLAGSEAALGQIPGMDAEFAGAGARSMAMGSAFIGLADDATASEFNPAGLQRLRRPELALQFRLVDERRTEHRFAKSLREVFEGNGQPRSGTFHDTYEDISFAAFTYPMQRLTLSLSQMSPIYFERTYFDRATVWGQDIVFGRAQDVSLRNYGLSAAYSLTDTLSLGVTGKFGRFTYDEKNSWGTDDVLRDNTLGANFGVLWKFHPWWSLGAVYKTSQHVEGSFEGTRIKLRIPETWGTGLAFHPNDRWRFLADVDYINWSNYDDSLAVNRNNVTGKLEWKHQDVTRYHLGSEYLLGHFWNTGVFLRAGYMLEDSNARYYAGSDPYFLKAAPKPDDIDHYSVGLGFARQRFQLDFACDYSEEKTQVIASTVIYF